MFASPCSAKHRSSRSSAVAFTPRINTPWLRTSRSPASSSARAAAATSGVTDCTWLMWVCSARLTPRAAATCATRLTPSTTFACSQCCGSAASAFVAKRISRMVSISSNCMTNDSSRGQGTFATSPPDTTTSRTRRCGAQVVQHSVLPVGRVQGQPGLADRWCGIADQIHPRAVTAILRAGRHQFGEYLGRVSMGQPFHHPHVALVQRISLGVGM